MTSLHDYLMFSPAADELYRFHKHEVDAILHRIMRVIQLLSTPSPHLHSTTIRQMNAEYEAVFDELDGLGLRLRLVKPVTMVTETEYFSGEIDNG